MASSPTPVLPAARPSQLIAEALVKRHGPMRLAERAARHGLSPELTRAMVVACGAAAIEPRGGRRPLPAV